MNRKILTGLVAPCTMMFSMTALAQEAPTLAVASAAPAIAANDTDDMPDPKSLTMPKLDFVESPTEPADYEKYFFFHRKDSSFAEAWADIRECDALSSGVNFYLDSSAAMAGATAQYGVLGAGIGGALGSMLADAITGSAMRRNIYRQSMRNCMAFKDYKRYALNNNLWKEFNFAEGMGRKREEVRDRAIALQALVASGPTPTNKELPL